MRSPAIEPPDRPLPRHAIERPHCSGANIAFRETKQVVLMLPSAKDVSRTRQPTDAVSGATVSGNSDVDADGQSPMMKSKSFGTVVSACNAFWLDGR